MIEILTVDFIGWSLAAAGVGFCFGALAILLIEKLQTGEYKR